MEITIDGQPVPIQPDYEIEMEEINPFFSKEGSKTLPSALPYTPAVLSLLDNPHRLARTNKLKADHTAVITSGIIRKVCRLVVFSASKEEGVQGTFYLNDGEFHTKIKDIKLTDIAFDNTPDPYQGSYAEKATLWMKHFEKVQSGQEIADYAIFPVCTKAEKQDDGTYKYALLNEPDTSVTASPLPLLGYTERTVDDVNCPVGYGVTPFLKLSYLLHQMFLHIGYILQTSPFDDDVRLADIVLLNNNADTICAGKLNYTQLVPSCTIAEFMEIIEKKFCVTFIPDGSRKTIEVKFFKDIAQLTPDMDLTPFVAGSPSFSFEPNKQLKLVSGTGLEFAQPATETMEQLMDENQYVAAVTEAELSAIKTMVGEVVLRKATGQLYKQINTEGEIILTPIGSSFFNYDKKFDQEYEEQEASDEQVPMAAYDMDYAALNGRGNPVTRSMLVLLPFVGEPRYLNTGIQKDKKTTEDKVDACKTMFCFPIGIQNNKIFMGSTSCYDYAGNQCRDLSLQYAGAYGLFVNFWKAYDALLRHAFIPVSAKLRMPVAEFMKFNIHTPKLLGGVPVIPTKIGYAISRRISHKGTVQVTAEFRTLRLLQPYDLATEQSVPPFNASKYYWIRADNISDIVKGYPTIDNKYFHRATIITSAPDARTYPAPTAEQMAAGGRYYVAQYQIDIHIGYYSGRRGGSVTFIPLWKVATVDYTTWLEPKDKSSSSTSSRPGRR